MAKTFKQYRNDYYDDEWGDYEKDDFHPKDKKLQKRKKKQKQRYHEKTKVFDEIPDNES